MRENMISVVVVMWAHTEGHNSEVNGAVMIHKVSHLVKLTI